MDRTYTYIDRQTSRILRDVLTPDLSGSLNKLQSHSTTTPVSDLSRQTMVSKVGIGVMRYLGIKFFLPDLLNFIEGFLVPKLFRVRLITEGKNFLVGFVYNTKINTS